MEQQLASVPTPVLAWDPTANRPTNPNNFSLEERAAVSATSQTAAWSYCPSTTLPSQVFTPLPFNPATYVPRPCQPPLDFTELDSLPYKEMKAFFEWKMPAYIYEIYS